MTGDATGCTIWARMLAWVEDELNNRIRAPRAGTVAQVHVSPGQQVQYGDLLVTFADAGQ